MEEYEIINLTPDMSEVWGNILKKLRTKNVNLYTILTTQVDVVFEREEIYVTTNDDSIYSLLSKYKFDDCVIVEKVVKRKNQKIEELKKLFGDKLTVVK